MKKFNRDNLLTLYGRKPALEALRNTDLKIFRLHLSTSNRPEGILLEIEQAANTRKVDIRYHSKMELSRISRNAQQDQGVAIDIEMPGFENLDDFLAHLPDQFRLLAVDGITNPQNLGMIIRSACAGNITAILLPSHGTAKLDALVVKASSGTLFQTRIIHCPNLADGLEQLSCRNVEICLMDSHGQQSLFQHPRNEKTVYVLGNETDGNSSTVKKIPHTTLFIPMNNQVESLNVAMTATVIAFLSGHEN